MSIRLTARQDELLGLIAKKFTADTREASPFAPEITPVEALRMLIMLMAQQMELIEMNYEPQESFDLPSKIRKPKKRPKK